MLVNRDEVLKCVKEHNEKGSFRIVRVKTGELAIVTSLTENRIGLHRIDGKDNIRFISPIDLECFYKKEYE